MELARSPDLKAIESLSARTITEVSDPALVADTVTKYAGLLSKITGKPANEFRGQLMRAIQRQGVAEGLLSPMLATYDQMSFLGADAADLVSPLIAQLNPLPWRTFERAARVTDADAGRLSSLLRTDGPL